MARSIRTYVENSFVSAIISRATDVVGRHTYRTKRFFRNVRHVSQSKNGRSVRDISYPTLPVRTDISPVPASRDLRVGRAAARFDERTPSSDSRAGSTGRSDTFTRRSSIATATGIPEFPGNARRRRFRYLANIDERRLSRTAHGRAKRLKRLPL